MDVTPEAFVILVIILATGDINFALQLAAMSGMVSGRCGTGSVSPEFRGAHATTRRLAPLPPATRAYAAAPSIHNPHIQP
jgi:hypothetical protein